MEGGRRSNAFDRRQNPWPLTITPNSCNAEWQRGTVSAILVRAN